MYQEFKLNIFIFGHLSRWGLLVDEISANKFQNFVNDDDWQGEQQHEEPLIDRQWNNGEGGRESWDVQNHKVEAK